MDDYTKKSRSYLETLCSVKPNRRTGSPGNRQATDFFAETILQYGYEIDTAPFECLDYIQNKSELTHNGRTFEVHVSPYSLGCDVTAELITVSTVEELGNADVEGKILLMRGAICSEQLMPKNFVFYNPEHHQEIISLLEDRKPAGIITATGKNPEQAGALYPFPLFVDGDFDIPNVYCTDISGDNLAALQGETLRLQIDARRVPSSASNIIARLNPGAPKKAVFTAHIDAYEDIPGALDNASGTIVLLLVAQMLSGYQGDYGIEIAALNGEDHYSAAGQMDYLKRYGSEFPGVLLAVNIDGVGYKRGKSSYSFYECPPQLELKAERIFRQFEGLVRGEPWYSGDHMIFVQSQVPSLAFTSEFALELLRTVVHTSTDTPDMIDPKALVEVAASLDALVRSL